MSDRRTWEIELPYKRPPLSLNDRMHWGPKSRISRELRMLARVKARHIPDLESCHVELRWYVNDKRRRDEDNPIATLKPLCDGLVDAEVVADDSYDLMTKRVRIVPVPKSERLAGISLVIMEGANHGEN